MAQCYHDTQKFISDMDIEVAKKGDKEGDILQEGQDLDIEFPCKKKLGHSEFIPFKALTVKRIQQEVNSLKLLESIKLSDNYVEMLENIKTWGDCVVRLVVDMKDGSPVRSGSGYVFKNGNEYQIKTDNHVVKTDDEVTNCTVEFFYESHDRSKIFVSKGVGLVHTNSFPDISSFSFDPMPDILDKLGVQGYKHSPPYHQKSSEMIDMLNNNNIDDVIMCCIGHPHGGMKMVSFGLNIFGTSSERFDAQGRSGRRIDEPGEDCTCKEVKCIKYLCATCPGSSGSPVFFTHTSYDMTGGITHVMGERVTMLLPDCKLIDTNINMGWC